MSSSSSNPAGTSRLLVVNAINLTTGGGRKVLREFLSAFAQADTRSWHAEVFVRSNHDLPEAPRIAYRIPALPRNAWLGRLWFERKGLRNLFKGREIDAFLSLQGSGARVPAGRHIIYCHNPLPLNAFPFLQWLRGPKIGVMRIIYEFLYRWTISPTATVIVQQEWLRKAFADKYGLRHIVVAHPVVATPPCEGRRLPEKRPLNALLPIAPYPYKNAEVVCEAMRLLAERSFDGCVLTITLDGSENGYARRLVAQYAGVRQIRFVGTQSAEEVEDRMTLSDILIFPSLIETWGLPLTEAKEHGLSILAADLPYAHETVGNYDRAGFFDPHDAKALAARIHDCCSGLPSLGPVAQPAPPPPFASNWVELVDHILSSQ